MKKSLPFILAILVLIFASYTALSHNSPRRIKNYPSFGTKIIAFGDSLVEGVGATEGNDLFSLLSRQLGEPIYNYGRAGDTTILALERLPDVLEEVPSPRVVVILLGGNDFLQGIPKEIVFSNLEKIIQSFQDHGAVVMLLGIRGGVFKDNFEKDFKNLRDTYHIAYVSNILEGLITDRSAMFDSIHPNDIGYERISERVFPVLKRISR